MINNNKDRYVRAAAFAAGVGALLALGACASDDAAAPEPAQSAPTAEASPAPAPAPATFNTGAPAPRFSIPTAATQAPPSVNTVPTTAPEPSSTEEAREEARKGLVADLANARHSEQGGRTLPVVVRPYVASASEPTAPAVDTPADPPIVDRLDAAPPPRPSEAGGAPAKPAAGPAPANKIPTGS